MMLIIIHRIKECAPIVTLKVLYGVNLSFNAYLAKTQQPCFDFFSPFFVVVVVARTTHSDVLTG